MPQAFHSPLISVASMDIYRWQHNPNQSYPDLSPKRNRNRGVILSRQGWRKLMQAEVLCDQFGYRYTYEQLSERSHLDERTVSRLLSCEIKVDKRTLKTFFCAFNLSLEADDYTLSNSDKASAVRPASTDAISTAQVEQLVEELSQLKQRMREYERLFHRLGLNENHFGQQLRA